MTQAVAKSHPKILPFLCLTEMWERFGFYVAQGLLVLYITGHFGLSDNQAYTISGIFAALVYISPFIGGILADRVLGFKTAILWGGLFLISGYAILATSGSIFIFYLGLSTIVVGNGLFKPNISSLLGTQYDSNNSRRDSGFTIFYIGINIGVALSGLSGYVKDYYGWSVTYSMASVGMFLGLMTFIYGLRYLQPAKKIYSPTSLVKLQIFVACVATIIGVNFLLHLQSLTNLLLPLSGIALLVVLALIVIRQNKANQKNLMLLISLILSSIVFWTLFLQIFNSANLYVSRLVDKNIMGFHLTSTLFWASESVFIFLLGPIFAWVWQLLGRLDKNPSSIHKFILGILFTSAAFCVLAYSTLFANHAGLINPLWVFGSYLLLTIGELLISPVGLSAVTQLAPERLVGMMMGVWFVATGFGGYFAGWLAKLASVSSSVTLTTQKLLIYQQAFLIYAAFALGVAIILFILQFLIRNTRSTH